MSENIGNLFAKCMRLVTKGHLYHLLGVSDYYGKTSIFITAGCSQNAAAFNRYVQHFLYKLALAGC